MSRNSSLRHYPASSAGGGGLDSWRAERNHALSKAGGCMKWLPRALLALALGWGLGPSVLAQAPPAPPGDIPRMVLKPQDSRELHWDFDSMGPVFCDAEGNMYLRPALVLRADKNPVWKFSPEGRKLVEFAPPTDTDDAGKEFRMGEFTVSGTGDFYALTYDGNATGMDYFLVSYASDGEVSSKTHLDLPAGFWVDKFAVFASGEILISGHYDRHAAEALRGQPRVLLLQNDGAPAGEVKLSGDARAKIEETTWSKAGKPVLGTLPQNSVTMGQDGNAYLLRGPEVLVISPQGKLVRTIPVSSPAADFHADTIQLSHGVLSVTFEKPNFGQRRGIEVMFRTFDPSTGVVQAEYVPGPELSNASFCFSAGEGYTFLGGKGQQTTLVRAWVR